MRKHLKKESFKDIVFTVSKPIMFFPINVNRSNYIRSFKNNCNKWLLIKKSDFIKLMILNLTIEYMIY